MEELTQEQLRAAMREMKRRWRKQNPTKEKEYYAKRAARKKAEKNAAAQEGQRVREKGVEEGERKDV